MYKKVFRYIWQLLRRYSWQFIKAIFIIWSGLFIQILGMIALPGIMNYAIETESYFLPLVAFLTIFTWGILVMLKGFRMLKALLEDFLK